MNTLIDRVLRAAQLDRKLFQEVEEDPTLNMEALTVIIVVSVVSGIGAFISTLMRGRFVAAIIALLGTTLIGIVNYYLWGYVTYFIGTNLFSGKADPGELLRVLGYASGPRILSIFGFIPCVGGLAGLAGAIWALVAGFIGVQEALDLDTTETLITVVVGWLVITIISAVIGGVLGIGALGFSTATTLLRR